MKASACLNAIRKRRAAPSFLARVEANRFGSSYIETEHLLRGLLREDRVFQNRPAQSIATSVDLPLSQDSKRALAYAQEESMDGRAVMCRIARTS